MTGKAELPELLDALLRTAASSGREGPVADVLAASLPEGVEVSRDGIGSLLMRLPGRGAPTPRLAIVGHMDEVGMMVTGVEPTWYPGRERESTPAAFPDLRIDVGAANAEDAAALVRIGDAAVIDVAPIALAHGRVASRALDNRFGMYVAVEVVRRLAAAGGGPTDVVGIGTVQEETAYAGARGLYKGTSRAGPGVSPPNVKSAPVGAGSKCA